MGTGEGFWERGPDSAGTGRRRVLGGVRTEARAQEDLGLNPIGNFPPVGSSDDAPRGLGGAPGSAGQGRSRQAGTNASSRDCSGILAGYFKSTPSLLAFLGHFLAKETAIAGHPIVRLEYERFESIFDPLAERPQPGVVGLVECTMPAPNLDHHFFVLIDVRRACEKGVAASCGPIALLSYG